ncbi:MAG TPA: hypothetical protein VI876_05460 [Dehalococcoidia bacterium]|jgi:hypothetical protein|nr:hypothetical protein [Dehalococcoidia bacterium]
MRRPRRRLRWLRAKAWRIARTQYLMSFPLVALIVAGAAALGAFDARAQPAPQRLERVSYIPTPIVYSTPVGFIPTDDLVVTYVLVDTADAQAALDSFENGLVWREVLQFGTFEVLLVTNADEEAAAFKRIAEARVRGRVSGFQVQVDDQRDN